MKYKELNAKLDRFPHIQLKLDMVWGTPQGRKYLEELLMTNRPDRQGFPFDIVLVLQDLLDLHDRTFPQFRPNEGPWDRIQLR